jgi:hypothetical protein
MTTKETNTKIIYVLTLEFLQNQRTNQSILQVNNFTEISSLK